MESEAKPGGKAAPRGTRPPKLSARNKALRCAYYLMFFYAPYRQLTLGQRRCFRRFHVAVFAAGTVSYLVHHDLFGATLMALGMVLSQAALKLVDRDLAGGDCVPRTRWNLPADLELKAPASQQR